MTDLRITAPKGRLLRLWAEFVIFFLLTPVCIAILLPPEQMFTALFAFSALGLGLLHVTPNFAWRDLVAGARTINWRFVVIFGLATAAVGTAVIQVFRPDAFLFLVWNQPQLLLLILLFYPFVSALPQEVVFRALFFRRYAEILPDSPRIMLILNAVFFSLAHLMYWSWIVAVMTFFGGLVFAYSYEIRRNFPEAVVLHGLAGGILFALGLGVYFYSGNVVRPF